MKLFFLLPMLALSAAVFAAEPANPHAGMKMQPMSAPGTRLTQQGLVLSTINVPTYTYIEAAQGKKTIWLATTTMAVKKGDVIRFDDGMTMNNFYSKSLKRTFPSIIFVSHAVVDSAAK